MSRPSPHTIAFTGLKLGEHKFDYQIDQKFFSVFLNSPIRKSNIQAEITFNKQEKIFLLTFDIEGHVDAICDRCNESFQLEILDQHKLIVKFEDSRDTEDVHDEEEIIYISRNETELNISQWIYEFIVLSLPLKIMHPYNKQGESSCSEEALALIKDHSIAGAKEQDPDPRWDPLSDVNY